jgi:hypothetical protein
VKGKVKGMLNIFFGIKGNVHKEFVLVGQTVNSAYYFDVLRRLCENVRRLRTGLWRQNLAGESRQRTASHFLFHQRIFGRNNMNVALTHPTFLCFPIEDKT